MIPRPSASVITSPSLHLMKKLKRREEEKKRREEREERGERRKAGKSDRLAMTAALKGAGCSAASFILAEDQDSVRALVSEHATREEPFLFSLEDVSTKGLCLQSQVVSRFFSDHSRLDLPIHLPLQNGTRRTVRDLPVNYLPTEDPGLQKIYKHSGSSVNWFRKPYGRIYLLTCENLADYKKKSR